MTKNTFWTAFKYLLAAGVLCYVVYSNWDGDEGLNTVWQRSIHGSFLLLAILLHASSQAACIVRWYLLVRAQELPFTMLAAFRLGTLASLCNAFMPGAVGGDVVKAAALAREQSSKTIAVATVVMDRAMSLWGLVFIVALVGGACWACGLLDEAVLVPAQVVIAASLIGVVASAVVWIGMGLMSRQRADRIGARLRETPKIGASLGELWQSVWLYRYRPASVANAILLTTFSNVCDILAFCCYAHMFWDGLSNNPLPSVIDHFLLVPMGLVISGVPLFPGGAGIGEAGFGGLYVLFGSAQANGVLASLLFRVCGWIIGIVGYVACGLLSVDSHAADGQKMRAQSLLP
ncbi:MAG TPA: lysylphosphatidylglycerol synthase transmembrane domain-containing protein [Gemmataceae bacterium]|nr:lysylphosphatidylglycerol synthase transmembrane domain-containing protein [Gemmataceae bacterium]